MNFRLGRNSKVTTQISGVHQSHKWQWNGTKHDRVPGNRYRCRMEATDLYGFQTQFSMICNRAN